MPSVAVSSDVFFYAGFGIALAMITDAKVLFNERPPRRCSIQEAKTSRDNTYAATGDNMLPGQSADLEALKYELEKEKFEWQKSAHRTENAVFNRHFGVIITAVVSIAAVIGLMRVSPAFPIGNKK
jgi:hypothetical protein